MRHIRWCFLFVMVVDVAECRMLGAFVLPHGGIALNPSRFDSISKWAKQWAWKIHKSAVEVGQYIRKLEPDIILLSTPHGVSDLKQFMFYMNNRANGSAQTDNCVCPPCCYDIDVKMDSKLTKNLVANLSEQGYNISGLSFFGPPGQGYEPTVLKWGEVIPLLFIKDLAKTKLVFLSQPSRRYTKSVSMIPELLKLGEALYDNLEKLPLKVVVIVSADLAHTHEATGPYGYSPAAEPFDRNCGNWAATLHPFYLLEKAAQYAQDAESCGYTGLVMLHGLLEAGKLSSWIPVLHANYHPSYYGMMVASFTRHSDTSNSDIASNFIDTPCPNCTPNRLRSKVGRRP